MHFSGLARKDLLGNVKASDKGLSAGETAVLQEPVDASVIPALVALAVGIDNAIRRRRKRV
jgi:hypothetical protein